MVAQIDQSYISRRPNRLWPRLVAYAMFEGRPLTTRGRWINPVLFGLFSLQKRLPVMRMPKAPVFILGVGRSGTTILGIVLSMHRDVGFLNEPKAIWATLRDDEDLIGNYHRGEARYRLGADDASKDVREAAYRIYGAYLRTSMTKRVVDKYPELIFRVPFVRRIFPDAKFLFLSRNGWDTCASIDSWSARRGVEFSGERHDWWGVNRRKWRLLVDELVMEHADLAPHVDILRDLHDQRTMAAIEWIVAMREGMSLLDKHPKHVMHVPYEKLCAEPAETCGRIAEFVGLEDDVVFRSYAQSVLSPSPHKPEFRLPDELQLPFRQTINELAKRG